MNVWRWVESIVLLLPVRLGLAAMFGTAGVLKLSDPQAFAFSIKAYDLLDPARNEHILVLLAFGIPWVEVLIALLLLLGLWTRAGALLLTLMLAAFTAGLLSVIARPEIDVNCACFGDHDYFCSGGVSWCHVGRNAVLMLASLLLVWRGSGNLAVESYLSRTPRVEAEPESA